MLTRLSKQNCKLICHLWKKNIIVRPIQIKSEYRMTIQQESLFFKCTGIIYKPLMKYIFILSSGMGKL